MDLEFSLSKSAGLKTKTQWNILKELCEYGNNEDIVREWLQYCELQDNKDAIFMNTLNGGITLPNKNIVLFRYCVTGLQTDHNIILNYIIAHDTSSHIDDNIIESARDLLFGFIKMANNRLGKDCAKGIIKLSNPDILYYSSDSE